MMSDLRLDGAGSVEMSDAEARAVEGGWFGLLVLAVLALALTGCEPGRPGPVQGQKCNEQSNSCVPPEPPRNEPR